LIEVVGVRFKKAGKIYYFDPKGLNLPYSERVIVETVRGLEIGTVVVPNRMVEEDDKFMPLSSVIRVATPADIKQEEQNAEKEKAAFEICEERIKKHNLAMTLIDVEYTFDNNKIIFCFVAEGRIDFRELVKDLAAVFRTRIELRQIGVRDETKAVGGLGICGRKICCAQFLSEFAPVSVKMAKDQSLSTNPQKISGACGKLICCLNFEQEVYEEAYKTMPRSGNTVQTPDGKGVVTESNVVGEFVRVRLEGADAVPKTYKMSDVKILSRGSSSSDKERDETEEKIADDEE
jgi:cell fate regulator YaaT (PSP1 superfamily)